MIRPGRRTASREEREHHLAAVSELYLQRLPQFRIAEQLDFSPSQISRDIQTLHKRWIAKSGTDMAQAVGEQLATLDEMERELWVAWQQSKKPYEETTTDQTTQQPAAQAGQQQPPPQTTRARAAIKRRERHGNPDYMTLILSVVQERSKLLGLYPAEKRDLMVGGTMGLSIAMLQQIAQEADAEGITIVDVVPTLRALDRGETDDD